MCPGLVVAAEKVPSCKKGKQAAAWQHLDALRRSIPQVVEQLHALQAVSNLQQNLVCNLSRRTQPTLPPSAVCVSAVSSVLSNTQKTMRIKRDPPPPPPPPPPLRQDPFLTKNQFKVKMSGRPKQATCPTAQVAVASSVPAHMPDRKEALANTHADVNRSALACLWLLAAGSSGRLAERFLRSSCSFSVRRFSSSS